MLLIISILVLTLLVVLVKKRFDYWKDRGIKIPENFFHLMRLILTQKSSATDTWRRIYQEFKSQGLQHGGMFFFIQPFYVPIDIEIVKNIMQVDFDHFVDRAMYVNEKGDPLSAHLFSLRGQKWKHLRQKLTPTFTSGKMKMMFETVLNCTQGLCETIDNESKGGLDIKDTVARFTTDIIGSCAYGLECNTLKNPDSEFRRNGNAFFRTTTLENFKNLLLFTAPELMLKFNMKLNKTDVSNFFMGVVKDTVAYREKNKIVRKDFMHLLIQLKNRGNVVDDGHLFDEKSKENDTTLTIEEVAAQAFLFFLAGFETSSTTMTFCLYELARNKKVQDKVRKEMARVLDNNNGQLTYEAVSEMHYLEQTIYETLRKYPPVPMLTRVCTKDYHVKGSDLILKKGITVSLPVVGIHYDPEYYPEPEKFDPERFSEENKETRPAFAFLPFGEGPRICIGLRFGMMQAKVGLTAILLNYEVTVSKKTKEPIEFDTKSFIPSTKGGMWLDFKKISPKTINLCTNKS